MSNNNGKKLAPVPAWIQSIREAVMQAVKPNDIIGIIEKQVELALEGDRDAAKFVFDYTIGRPQAGTTLIQNNIIAVSDEPPQRAIDNHPHQSQPVSRSTMLPPPPRVDAGILNAAPKERP